MAGKHSLCDSYPSATPEAKEAVTRLTPDDGETWINVGELLAQHQLDNLSERIRLVRYGARRFFDETETGPLVMPIQSFYEWITECHPDLFEAYETA